MIGMRIGLIVSLLSLGLQCFGAGASHSGLLIEAGVSAGIGSSGDKNDAIKKRDMAYTELFLNLGYQFGMIAPLVQASYRYIGQTTEASDVSDTNMAGTGNLAGAGLMFDFTSFQLTAVYDMTGSFTMSKETAGGSKTTYSKPKGYHVNLEFPWKPSWSILINYSSIEYQKSKTDSSESDLSSNPVYQTLYGLGLGYRF